MRQDPVPGMNCIKIGLPRKSILRDYFQENMISQRPFLYRRISFTGRPIFTQLPPGGAEPRRAGRHVGLLGGGGARGEQRGQAGRATVLRQPRRGPQRRHQQR